MYFLKKIKNIFYDSLWYTVVFFISIVLFLFVRFCLFLAGKISLGARQKMQEWMAPVSQFLVRINRHNLNTISRIGLMELAVRSMIFNKSRSFITVGGMALGIGAIVFLVSLGYGVQELVVSKVANLEEMRQANVTAQSGTKIYIDDRALSAFKNIPAVESVLPLLSVVGNVEYQNSVSDMAVYGVTSEYLKQSAIQPSRGRIFESDDISVSLDAVSQGVRRQAEVLGEADARTNETSISSAGGSSDWIDLEGETKKPEDQLIKKVAITTVSKKEAVVNRAVLSVLGIGEADALGKKFAVSFVVVGDLLENPEEKIQSISETYEIVGITPDDGTPQMYVPFVDIRSMGLSRYSQVKIVVQTKEDLELARSQIESLGFVSTSVVDTVNQINNLFATARLILALLGMVALAVASLGMFNTLTVSLLERTREVGLMKAMGMRSSEVKELFLTESMVMGSIGGILGILFGYILGKGFGALLSVFSLVQGAGFIDVTYIPFVFVLFILILSLFVGIVTGIYPARRSAKISALNALRYE